MYLLSITKIKHPYNDTIIHEYSSFENMCKGLKFMIDNDYLSKNDIIRIKVEEVSKIDELLGE